jgi:anti-anti-sigma factor
MFVMVRGDVLCYAIIAQTRLKGFFMTNEGRFLFAVADSICILKPVGNITYTISPNLDAFLRKAFTSPDIKGFVIDLTETEYIDSTNLGLLARIHEHSRVRLGSRPAIVSVKPAINDILDNLGFHKIFDMIYNPVREPGLSPVENADEQHEGIGRIMLQAHQCLMRLNEHNRQCFRDVVEYMRRDVSGDAPESDNPE